MVICKDHHGSLLINKTVFGDFVWLATYNIFDVFCPYLLHFGFYQNEDPVETNTE